MFQSGMVVWSDNFQLCCISIRPRIDGSCSMYCCRVLARRAGELVVIALVLLNMIHRDCLWIGVRGRQVWIVVYGFGTGVAGGVCCCWECACVG